ncbi:SDR family NAD(P)-dependent oxidoreductase [Paenibacillus daejeonensis]|uniref:SDR family NAD(P)-dependent oxidoreductase n=1 Tax=Paenibacillus daejeonensis TaxID=135193 RepID=UPI000380F1C4|nr:SDR family oxidoreductase [Paenibacillus daejeonensis]
MDVTGKTALVTGAGTGIGQGVAIELARRGAKVAVHYNSSREGAENTRRQIEALGGEAHIVQGNIANQEEVQRFVSETADALGGLDILVNNAALQLNLSLLQHDETSFDKIMHTNLKGYWLCMQAALPHLKKRSAGRVINISSVHAKRPTDFDPVYSMSKGGIRMLTREAAIELGQHGITVNAIEPGAVDVGKQQVRPELPPAGGEPMERSDFRMHFPLGRAGKPQDVGHLVCFIASDASAFLSGAAIRLDGASMLL